MSRIAGGVLLAVLTCLLVGCGEKLPPYMEMRLPSGRMVKVQSYLPENLFTGEKALLLKYVPDAPLEDEAALDAEVASLWKEVMQDVLKRPGARLVLIRAISQAPAGWAEGPQVQYVYRLQPDGSWTMEKDPLVRLR